MPLLDRSNLIDALLVASTCKRRFKPRRHNLTRYFRRNQASAERKNICVIVLTAISRGGPIIA
jgi:hypothetical protein